MNAISYELVEVVGPAKFGIGMSAPVFRPRRVSAILMVHIRAYSQSRQSNDQSFEESQTARSIDARTQSESKCYEEAQMCHALTRTRLRTCYLSHTAVYLPVFAYLSLDHFVYAFHIKRV